MKRKLWLAGAALAVAISLSCCSTSSAPVPAQTKATADPVSTATAPAASLYIGAVYPPLPAGWQDGRAALTATVGDVEYSVQELAQAKQQMLWFLKSTGRDAQGHLTWIVTDVLARSDIQEPGGLIWGFCTLNDQPDEEIVALGDVKAARMDTVYRAWRANHATGHFEPIAATGIVCVDETIGP
jgi:hypothetical protein